MDFSKIDYSDLGNLGLAVSGAAAVYAASLGQLKLAAAIGGFGVMFKAVCSAIDNFKFKKAMVA